MRIPDHDSRNKEVLKILRLPGGSDETAVACGSYSVCSSGLFSNNLEPRAARGSNTDTYSAKPAVDLSDLML